MSGKEKDLLKDIEDIKDVEFKNEVVPVTVEPNPNITAPEPDVDGVSQLSPLELQIATMYSEGMSANAIAEELGTTAKIVRGVLSSDNVSKVAKELVRSRIETTKEARVRLISKIIEDKIELYEKSGQSLAGITDKDVVDLIGVLDRLQAEEEKAKLGTNTNNAYINILNTVLTDKN